MNPNIEQNTKRHIYLADDDIDDREIFVDAVKAVDASVVLREAEDGVELMNILTTFSDMVPEIVFLDLNMPRMSGFECLEEIRKQDGAIRNLNVIVFSTSQDPQNIEKAKALGADFYAVKPDNFEMLKKFLSDVLNIDWRLSNQKDRAFRLI
ncbi:MAG: response regulator [Chryseobacterium sp.]|jgi:CheY-like chemotaxis protein|nr:MAG: response regulator [Chryseobacterium sp.]